MAWLQTQILNGTYESIFTCYLDRLTKFRLFSILCVCVYQELFKMPAVIKFGGTDPLKGAVFCVILSKKNKTVLPSNHIWKIWLNSIKLFIICMINIFCGQKNFHSYLVKNWHHNFSNSVLDDQLNQQIQNLLPID